MQASEWLVGNGTAKAREAADYIADSIDEDGPLENFCPPGPDR